MGKSRKSSEEVNKSDSQIEDQSMDDSQSQGKSWEDKVKNLSPISRPLASKKLAKKLFKAIKKAKASNTLKKGIKQVQKSLRRGERGIVVLAGDVSPMDIISHVPVMCEEKDIPYCFIPSKRDLGEAYGSKRQACMVLIQRHDSYDEKFNECASKINELPLPY